jgi:hypothetical protein
MHHIMQCGIIFQIAPASDFPKLPTSHIILELGWQFTEKSCLNPTSPTQKKKKKKNHTSIFICKRVCGLHKIPSFHTRACNIDIKANDEY